MRDKIQKNLWDRSLGTAKTFSFNSKDSVLQVTAMRISTKAGCMNYLLLSSKLTTKDFYKTINLVFGGKRRRRRLWNFHQSLIFGSGLFNGKNGTCSGNVNTDLRLKSGICTFTRFTIQPYHKKIIKTMFFFWVATKKTRGTITRSFRNKKYEQLRLVKCEFRGLKKEW